MFKLWTEQVFIIFSLNAWLLKARSVLGIILVLSVDLTLPAANARQPQDKVQQKVQQKAQQKTPNKDSNKTPQETQIAKRWMRLVKYESTADVLSSLQMLRPDLKPAPSDPILAAKVKAMVTQIDAQYRRAFPKLMRNKSFPDYILIEANSFLEAFTYTTNEIDKGTYSGFVAIPSGPFRDPKAVASVAGMLSHELAHLYLHHQAINETFLKVWRSPDPNSGIDRSSQAVLAEYLENAAVAGNLVSEAFGGMPLDPSLLQTSFAQLLSQLVSQFGDAACIQELVTKLPSRMSLMTKDFSYFDWGIKFANSAATKKLQSEISDFESELIACSRSLGFDGKSLRLKLLPLQQKLVFSEQYLSAKFNEPFTWKGQNDFAVIFKLEKILRAEMRKQVAQAQLEQIRWRSFEDEADEFAVIILRSLQLSPTAFVRSLVSIFEPQEPGLTKRCEAAIMAKAEIPFGYLGDAHHSACYRLQTVQKLALDSGFSAKP